MQNLKWKYSKFLLNKNFQFSRNYVLKYLPSNLLVNSHKSISKWKGYSPTPLLKLNKLNKKLQLKNIFYKDESKRFHLKSFKALGGAYAVEKISKKTNKIIVSSATAGNHGRSVAWGAKRLKLQCKIFVSQYVSETRVKEIKKFGAEVIRVRGNYEASLKECQLLSKQNNWKIVQDVSTKNYKYIPQLTMAGYSILIKEISNQTNQYITHIFLQAGVGGMASGAILGVAQYFKRIPKIIIVEPENADCVLQSVDKGSLQKVNIKKESIMGGMSCGEVSLVPWKILKNSVNLCTSISDKNVAKTIAMLKNNYFCEKNIIGGECATPGIISLISVCENQDLKNKISLDENSNVLVIGCEGDADEILYKKLLDDGKKELGI